MLEAILIKDEIIDYSARIPQNSHGPPWVLIGKIRQIENLILKDD